MAIVVISTCNLAAKLVDWQAGTKQDPGLNMGSKTWANNEVRTSDTLDTQGIRKTRVHVKLTSGAFTLAISVHSGTPDFGSPTKTVTISGTDQMELDVDTTAVNKFVTVRGTAGGAGAVLFKAGAIVTGRFSDSPNRGYHEARFGFCSLMTQYQTDLP